MKTHHRLDVTLTLLGPILTRGGMMAEPGIDAPLARRLPPAHAAVFPDQR